MLSTRNSEQDPASRRTSPAPTSPRAGQKRFRNDELTLQSGAQTPLPSRASQFHPDASIVLVGIRGCGKRSLGFIAAAALGRRFITEDHYFQTVTGLTRQDFLRIHGSEEFHKQDVEASRRMLNDNKHGCVIDCGLGSLTRGLQDHLRNYCQTNPVILIQRDMGSIKRLLKLSDRSAKMLENGDQSHRRCSNYEYYNIEDSTADFNECEDDRASPTYSFKLRDTQTDFSDFVRAITGVSQTNGNRQSTFSSTIPIETKLYTHALQLHVSRYQQRKLDFSALEAGGDVAEILIDEWQESTPKLVSHMAAEIRRHLRLPIMISVRQVAEDFPLNLYFAALRHAQRLAPAFLVLDMTMEKAWLYEFKCCRCLVGSIRYRKVSLISDTELYQQVEKAISLGIDLVRLTAHATSRSDTDRFEQFVRGLKSRYGSRVRFSTYLTGTFGRTTQVFNPILTAVTHQSIEDALAEIDAPAHLSAYEALKGLFASFTLDALKFYVFGANVSSSLSPAMHNAAYRATGLPHEYRAVNVDTWEDIHRYARSPVFGGASVAQPWKVKIIHQLSNLSDHARGIGAINTLIPIRGEIGQTKSAENQAVYRNRAGAVFGFYGDNSDWLSIQITLNKNLSPRNVIHGRSTALIIGAGGMARAACYALLQMGCRNIFIYNRTISNAVILADHFSRWSASQDISAYLKVLESIDEPWPEGYAQPTIIVSCVTHERLPGEEQVADFTVPEQWLGSETGGAAVEQAYYISTPFTQQIKHLHATTGKPWVVVDGLEVLHAQATAQFEIMTGRKPPTAIMWKTLQQAVQERDGKM